MRTLNLLIALTALLVSSVCSAKTTNYSPTQCQGSLRPYPQRDAAVYPDSLAPFYIYHLSRHGSRYPAGAANTLNLIKLLNKADSLNTITPLGRKLLALSLKVAEISKGRWGELDSLGMAEQRGIARRMMQNYPQVFAKGKIVDAISSYSPRSMMSMFSYVHEMDIINSNLLIQTATGHKFSPLMRFFDVAPSYLEFRDKKEWEPAYNAYIEKYAPLSAWKRVVGEKFPLPQKKSEAIGQALLEYYLIAGLEAMEINNVDALEYFTTEEYNLLWSCFNLRQYLQRTNTHVSSVPADIAAPLLREMTDKLSAAECGTSQYAANMAFGHAETLMPILSLLRVPGCNFETSDYACVDSNWKDFYVVPMAANFRVVLFKAPSGIVYARCELNEEPVALVPNRPVIIRWDILKDYFEKVLNK